MKKRLLVLLFSAVMMLSLWPMMSLAAVTSLSDVSFTVKANPEAGLDGDVKIAFTRSGSNYNGTLYLPGSADASALKLSWDEGVSVSDCTSGETAIPANGESETYSVTVGGSTANFIVKTMQGSAGVAGMFLNIDESLGTIKAMYADQNHETDCFGQITFAGKTKDMSVKGRGNSTWTYNFDKKPLNLTIYKSEDPSEGIGKYDKKDGVKFIDNVKSKKWSLLANAKDSSLIRNKIGYDIACKLGIGLESRFVDLWMNGKYIGNFLLTPKADYAAPEKGYQIEIDNKVDNADPQFTLPNFDGSSKATRFTVKDNGVEASTDDIKAYIQKAANAIFDKTSSDYLKYIDLDSWAKCYLLNELYKDIDVVSGSKYMYRNGLDDSDKLFYGPVWDLDGTFGRTVANGYTGLSRDDEIRPDNWHIDSIQSDVQWNKAIAWLQELGKHKDFMERVYELYNEYKETLETIPSEIDKQSELIADSAEMNFDIYDVNQTVEKYFNVEKAQTVGSGKYQITYAVTEDWLSYMDNLKLYVKTRLNFLSDCLTTTVPGEGSITGTTDLTVDDTLTLTSGTTANSYQWQSSLDGENWTNIDGATAQIYSTSVLYTMNGLQIRCVAKNTKDIIKTVHVAQVAPAASTVLAPVTLTVSLEGHEHHYADVVTDPTCTEKGYTTHTCACGDVKVDNYTDPLGHNYVGGKCTRCQERDPAYEPQCVVNKNVSLSEGKLFFTLGGQNLGEYTFARSGNNWTIKDADGKYLGFAGNALSDNEFAWTYSDGRFQTSETTGGNNGWGGILGFLFGGFGGWGGNTTTTYYLVYTNGRIAVSTSSNGANASFTIHVESDEHSGTWKTVGKTHTRKCEVCGTEETEPCTYVDHRCIICGGYDPSVANIEVNVTVTQRITGGNTGWNGILDFISRLLGILFGNRGNQTTTYTATITTIATGTTVSKVEYSTNDRNWTQGTSYQSNQNITTLYVRVTGANGVQYNYLYQNGETKPVQ